MGLKQREWTSDTANIDREPPPEGRLADALVADGPEAHQAALPGQNLHGITYVAEEIEFRRDDDHIIETVDSTVLDDDGVASGREVRAHPVN